MNYLLRSQLRDLVTRPITSIALLLNLILAVFAVIVVHVTSHTLVHELTTAQLHFAYQYVVPFKDKQESSYFELRANWRAGNISEITGMVPVIEGNLAVNGRAVPLIGIDMVGDLPVATTLGDDRIQTELLTQDSVITFGNDLATATFPSHITVLDHHPGQQSFLLADIATAQNLLQRNGEVDAAWLRYQQMPMWEWLEHLSPGITTAVGIASPDISVPNFDIQAMEVWNPAQAFGGSIAFNMGLLGMLAVLVSGFIAYEATVSSVRRRAREFDRLQTIGVTAGKIRLVLIIEALVLVLPAVLIATGLAFVFLEQSVLVDNVIISSFMIATAKGSLLVLSTVLIGVSLAFVRASRIPSRMVLLFMLLLAVAVFCYGVWMSSNLASAYLAILAVCVLHIVVLTPSLVQIVNALVSRFALKNLISRMNLRAVCQHLRQANIAVVAFSLAIGTAIGITLMISSLRTDFFALLDARLPAGIQIREAGQVNPETIKQWSGVVDVREYYRGQGNLSIGKISVVATTLDEFEAHRYGYTYDSESVGIYVNEKAAAQAHVQVGDELTVNLPGAEPINFPIVHIFKSYGELSRIAIIPRDQVAVAPLVRDRLLIVVEPDSLASVERLLHDAYPATVVLNNRQIRERAVSVFDRTFALTNLIALIAVLVAVIGLFNSALAKQSAKREEFRLLETLGFTKFALIRQSFTQATILGLLCCLLSLPLGLGVAWILCEFVNPRAFQWTISLHISPTAVALPVLLGMSAVVLASLLPGLLSRRSL